MKNFYFYIVVFTFSFFLFNLGTADAAVIIQRPLYIGLTSGLVGFWSFDGNGGLSGSPSTGKIIAFDQSGQGNHGTQTGTAIPKPVAGKLGQALEFDGIDKAVRAPDHASISGLAAVSVSVWIKPSVWKTQCEGGDCSQFIVAKSNWASNREYRLRYESSTSVLKFQLSTDGSNTLETLLISVSAIPINSWSHIVGTWDGATDVARLYLNGTLFDSDAFSGTTLFDGTANFSIGSSGDGLPNENRDDFFGSIDDVRIYNRALSPEEIKRLYNIGATFKINQPAYTGSLQDGLVGFWSFDGATVSGTDPLKVDDLSGQGNQGSASGSAIPKRVAGNLGQALEFDGVDDYVNIPHSASIDLPDSGGTVSAWFKLDKVNLGSDKGWPIFKKLAATNELATAVFLSAYQLGSNDIPTLRAILGNAGAVDTFIASTKIYAGVWYHGAVVWTDSRAQLYVNGVPVGSGSRDDAISYNENSAAYIGRDHSTAPFSDGSIDDVRIYNRALSADEIKRLYNIGGTFKINKPAYTGSLDDGLVGFWSFDGATVSGTDPLKVDDLSGQGNQGSASGSAIPKRVAGKLGQALEFDGVDDYVPLSTAFASIARVQSQAADGADPTATFSSAPTEGNLLVAIAFSRSGTSNTSHSISGTGWTKRVGRDTELADANARRSLSIWTKTAGASEPSAIQVTGDTVRLMIQEFSGGTFTFLEKADNDTGTGSASPLSTGTTASVSDGDLLVMGAAAWRNDITDPGSISWTNGITNTVQSLGGGNGRSINTGFVQETTGGTKESEVSWTGTGHEASAAILVFSAALDQLINIDTRAVSFWMKARSTTEKIITLTASANIEVSGGTITANGLTSPTIYVDGNASSNISADTWHLVTVVTNTAFDAFDLEIGRIGSGYFDGLLDNIRLYNRALSPEEIKRLYNIGNPSR